MAHEARVINSGQASECRASQITRVIRIGDLLGGALHLVFADGELGIGGVRDGQALGVTGFIRSSGPMMRSRKPKGDGKAYAERQVNKSQVGPKQLCVRRC